MLPTKYYQINGTSEMVKTKYYQRYFTIGIVIKCYQPNVSNEMIR
jgi:hypothetical protein